MRSDLGLLAMDQEASGKTNTVKAPIAGSKMNCLMEKYSITCGNHMS